MNEKLNFYIPRIWLIVIIVVIIIVSVIVTSIAINISKSTNKQKEEMYNIQNYIENETNNNEEVDYTKLDEGIAKVELPKIEKNIIHNNAENVKAQKGDIFESAGADKTYDLIVSNPPYIPESEIELMRRNVVDYEPHLALFVPDDDPLKFYRAITRSAFGLLSEGGVLGFEVHENYARQCGEMILGEGFSSVEVLRDIFEKERMVWAQR